MYTISIRPSIHILIYFDNSSINQLLHQTPKSLKESKIEDVYTVSQSKGNALLISENECLETEI